MHIHDPSALETGAGLLQIGGQLVFYSVNCQNLCLSPLPATQPQQKAMDSNNTEYWVTDQEDGIENWETWVWGPELIDLLKIQKVTSNQDGFIE